MKEEQLTRLIKRNEAMVVLCTYSVLFANDIAIGRVIEAVDKLKKSDWYRFEVKQKARKVEEEMKRYERVLNKVVGRSSDFFADANEKFLDEVEKDVEVMYFSVKRVFDRACVERSELMAMMEMARSMCMVACVNFDKRMEELRAKDPMFRGVGLTYLRQTELLKCLNMLIDVVPLHTSINLNTDECKMAVRVLSGKLADGRRIAGAIS